MKIQLHRPFPVYLLSSYDQVRGDNTTTQDCNHEAFCSFVSPGNRHGRPCTGQGRSVRLRKRHDRRWQCSPRLPDNQCSVSRLDQKPWSNALLTTRDRLASYLGDSTARVIMLDRTFDFVQTEGSTTAQCCSDNRTSKCPGGTSQGQLSIQATCDSGTWQSCTYWNAPRTPLKVASNKSIVGVGTRGVIRGKGLRLNGGVSNVIIQNIHFTVSSTYNNSLDGFPFNSPGY